MSVLLAFLIILLTFVKPAFATDSPILSSPTDKSTVPESTLNWQEVSGAIQYRVIVDDEESVSSPYLKNYYATKLQYSPKLDLGKYYWKVSAKDSSGNWSTYSPVWSFTLTEPSPSPVVTATEKPKQTPTPKASLSISPSPSLPAVPSPIASKISPSPSIVEEVGEFKESSVAGIATLSEDPTPSPLIEATVSENNSPNFLLILGTILIGLGIISGIYLFIKSKR